MRPVAERDVPARVGAFHLEVVGLAELARVAVGGSVDDHERCARRNLDAAELRRDAREPEVTFHGALDAQALLDEVGHQLTVLA